MLSEFAPAASDIAVFEAAVGPDGATLRYARGLGAGRLLSRVPPLVHPAFPGDSRDEEALCVAIEATACTLASHLQTDGVEVLAALADALEAGQHVVVLVVPKDRRRLAMGLTDFELACAVEALSAQNSGLLISHDRNQIACTTEGAASRLAVVVGPKKQGKIMSVERVIGVDDEDEDDFDDADDFESDDDDFEGGDDDFEDRLVVSYGGVHVRIEGVWLAREWFGKLPKDLAVVSQMKRLAAGRDALGEPAEAWKIAEEIEDDILVWLDSSEGPADVASHTPEHLYDKSLAAPLHVTGMPEEEMERLIRLALWFDDMLGGPEPRFAHKDSDSFLGCVLFGGRAYPLPGRAVEVSCAWRATPAAFRSQYPMSYRAASIVEEILKAAAPEGEAIERYATNRPDSAVPGPARRIYEIKPGEISAHERLEVMSALETFLKSRGWSDERIAEHLRLES